ncbi:MAG: aldehyde dehydrogenase family protein, partial [Patescibacteria group bacterium]
MIYPSKILHFLGGQEVDLGNEVSFKKYNPATGELLAEVIRGDSEVAKLAVVSAEKAFLLWSEYSAIARANILKKTAELIGEKKDEIAEIIALECGKSKKSSIGEVEAAVKCGLFLVEQTKEFDPEKLVSGVPARELELVRQSIGVGALITPFNNPMAGIA